MQSRIDYTLFEGCTEGPWRVEPVTADDFVYRDIIAAGGQKVMEDWNTSLSSKDANLIAAAPILLEEHKALMEENERLREALGILLAHYEGMDDIWTDADMAAIGPARAALQDKSSGV